MDVLGNISNAMQVFGVDVVGRDKETARLLDDSVGWLWVQHTILFGFVNVETQTGTQADSADDWVVCRTVLVRHNPLARRIFIDEDMIRTLVRASGEEVRGEVMGRHRDGKESLDHGLVQPGGQRSIQKSVLDKIGWPSLESSVRELLPSWFWCIGNLE